MKKVIFLLTCMVAGFFLQSCDNNDDPILINQEVEMTFREKYPSVTRVNWERKGLYYVADFVIDKKEAEAWIDAQGIWYMTETDIAYNDLPDAVKNAFKAGEYASWRVDDVDMLERKDMEVVYVIEVEQGNTEYDLYYTADGTLVKAIMDSDDDSYEDHLPSNLTESIKSFITTNYPHARIIEIEIEKGMIEVDIMDVKTPRELMFNPDGEWVYTKTDIGRNNVPQEILDVLLLSKYASYEIDDVDYVETPQKNYYYFEVESRSEEVELIITTDGELEVVKVSKD